MTDEHETSTTAPRWGVWRRFACYCIDRMAAWMLVLAGTTVYSLAATAPEPAYGDFYARSTMEALLLMFSLAVFHWRWGQSPGKVVGYLRVVRLDGTAITGVQALARSLFSHGIEIVPLLIYFTAKERSPLILLASFLYLAIDGLFVLADKEHRRALHDIIAGTRVVSLACPAEIGEGS